MLNFFMPSRREFQFTVWFCVLVLWPSTAHAQWNYCRTEYLPIVLLHRNADTGAFTLVERIPNNESSEELLNRGSFRLLGAEEKSHDDKVGNRRGLRRRDMDDDAMSERMLTEPSSTHDDGQATNNATQVVANNDTQDYFYARECSCFEPEYSTVYCPFSVQFCKRPGRNNKKETTPICVTEVPNTDRNKPVFHITIVFYVGVLAYLFGTKYGRSIFDYIITTQFYSKWNERVADRILRNDPEWAESMIRDHFLREYQDNFLRENPGQFRTREMLQQAVLASRGITTIPSGNNHNGTASSPNTTTRKPVSLALKTRRYGNADEEGGAQQKTHDGDTNDDDDDDDDDDDAPTCVICFAHLEEGERVGVLPCSHTFHAQCLKSWLQKKNSCPLCQLDGIAEPRFDDDGGCSSNHTEEGTDLDSTTMGDNIDDSPL